MHGERVANIRIYVVNRQVEPLLSGPAAEALGIITLNVADPGGNTWEDGKDYDQEANIIRISANDDAAEVLKRHENCFSGIGKLKHNQVKLHIDEDIMPVASRPDRFPFICAIVCELSSERWKKQGSSRTITGRHHGFRT